MWEVFLSRIHSLRRRKSYFTFVHARLDWRFAGARTHLSYVNWFTHWGKWYVGLELIKTQTGNFTIIFPTAICLSFKLFWLIYVYIYRCLIKSRRANRDSLVPGEDSDLCVGIIGMGHMGRQLLTSLLEKSGIKPSQIKISSRTPDSAGTLAKQETNWTRKTIDIPYI